jgi:hypothetical protein
MRIRNVKMGVGVERKRKHKVRKALPQFEEPCRACLVGRRRSRQTHYLPSSEPEACEDRDVRSRKTSRQQWQRDYVAAAWFLMCNVRWQTELVWPAYSRSGFGANSFSEGRQGGVPWVNWLHLQEIYVHTMALWQLDSHMRLRNDMAHSAVKEVRQAKQSTWRPP